MKKFRSLLALSASVLLAACAATAPSDDTVMEGDNVSSAMMEDTMSSDAMMEGDKMMEGEVKMEVSE